LHIIIIIVIIIIILGGHLVGRCFMLCCWCRLSGQRASRLQCLPLICAMITTSNAGAAVVSLRRR